MAHSNSEQFNMMALEGSATCEWNDEAQKVDMRLRLTIDGAPQKENDA